MGDEYQVDRQFSAYWVVQVWWGYLSADGLQLSLQAQRRVLVLEDVVDACCGLTVVKVKARSNDNLKFF